MIDLSFRNSTSQKQINSQLIKGLAEATLAVLELKGTYGVSVSVVGPVRMRELNKSRGKNAPTDVLSFPLRDGAVDEQSRAILELGDLFLCPDMLKRHAQEKGTTFLEETKLMTIHGFLHLLGYDHEQSSRQAKQMFSLEAKILKQAP